MAIDWLKQLLSFKPAATAASIAPGLYHKVEEVDGVYTRFHLRVERDGSGMLIANAAAAARLSATGVLIAKDLLDGKSEEQILNDLKARFKGASEERMHADVEQVRNLIVQLETPSDQYPIFNLEDPALSARASELIAPLQAAIHVAAPEKLRPIVERLWEVGIPHVTLWVGPEDDTDHLVRAVEHAEDLGMIAGVRGRASELWKAPLLSNLVQAGVDHVTFPYASADAITHDALFGDGDHAAAESMLDWLEENQICAVAEVPLIQATLDVLEDTLEALMSKGADNICFVAFATTDTELASRDGVFAADGLPQVAAIVEDAANASHARFIWDPPVQRNPAKSLPEQVLAGPRCSGDVAVRIEADGSVIPPRGPYVSAGNLLQQSWDSIWEHDVFQVYRERVEAPTHCEICPGLAICAADCPREPRGWALEV